jgi:putative DNA methylase
MMKPDHDMKTAKKLIEVALPLEAINVASAREKSIRHGHPSTLHLWWARRPLAAARAVIFAQMVDDPSEYVETLLSVPETKRAAERELKARHQLWEKRKAEFEAATGKEEVTVPEPGPAPTLDDCAADIERQRLFRIIEELVKWENTTNEHVLEKAKEEIWQSWRRACAANADHPRAKELFDRNKLPAFHDPFAGGGALPLEAQRLGLEAYASDLNPVAVLINKAMIEIPPKFAGRAPVNPTAREHAKNGALRGWKGAQGLAEDVGYYGRWMRDEAEKRIGNLYPKIEITPDMAVERPDLKSLVGQRLTVIAWLWARTVKSPNPAFRDVDVPLASTFLLSTKAAKGAYVEPVIADGGYRFRVKLGKPVDVDAVKTGTKIARGANFKCVMSGSPIDGDYIKSEGRAGRIGERLMAIVAEGERGRVYLAPTSEHEQIAIQTDPDWRPETPLPDDPRNFWTVQYGFTTFGHLFTRRQLTALNAFSDLVSQATQKVQLDAVAAGMPDDAVRLTDGGVGATAYADALAVYLGFGSSRASDAWSSVVTWRNQVDATRNTFARQSLPMTWDFAEANPFSESCGHWLGNSVEWVQKSLTHLPIAAHAGRAMQANAATQEISVGKVISTDPPYYDNIAYADLSDFFYVWLRRALQPILPQLFPTLAVPKAEELVATPYRHGGKDAAEKFFLDGMTSAMHRLAELSHPAFPATIYYAFKQSETSGSEGTASTGWETFLDAVVRAGFGLSGTWPMRTEKQGRVISNDTNALASSIILVCRQRGNSLSKATRREFLNALKLELPDALRQLQRGNIAPVDLAQASIGPGMAIFTRYETVVDAEGKLLSVRDALALINSALDEVLAEQEGDFDADSRWALAWFEQLGFAEGEFGVAETLSKAKVTSIGGLVDAGIVASKSGKVRLLKPDELDVNWDPATDTRLTVWDMTHHLIRTLEAGGEAAAALLAAKLGTKAEIARELAYRLYTVCERKKRATEALAYNALVQSWPEITRLARDVEPSSGGTPQSDLFGVG